MTDQPISKHNYSIAIFTMMLMIFFTGCKPKPPVPPRISLDEVINNYNENFYKIPPLKPFIDQWTLDFVDDKNESHHYNGVGGRIFFAPSDNENIRSNFYMFTNTLIYGETLVIGSNNNEFWMYTKAGEFGSWGKYEHLGKECASEMPFDPQLLLDFIGWRPLSSKGLKPAYRVSAEQNIIEYIESDGIGLRIEKEIIFDRYTNLAKEINRFGWDGQLIMHSELTNYINVGDNQAKIPSIILISFPANQSSMKIKLVTDRILVDSSNRTRLFQRLTHPEGISNFQQIDIDCE